MAMYNNNDKVNLWNCDTPNLIGSYEDDVAKGVISPFRNMKALEDYINTIKGSFSCKKYQGKFGKIFYEIELNCYSGIMVQYATIIVGNESREPEKACHETVESALVVLHREFDKAYRLAEEKASRRHRNGDIR